MTFLSPRDLARSLGVSESSVKRWVDDGAVTATRTAGGHRRIARAEAVRFVRESGVPVVRPDLIVGKVAKPPITPVATAEADVAGDRLFALLEADDSAAARAMVSALFVSGWSVAAICDGPMRHALERIGSLWRHGPGGIVVEHRATNTCIRALAELRTLFTPPARNAPAAVGAAPSGDPYVLPSMMAAAVLADLGYRDHDLGADCPLPALTQAVERYRPRLVWLAMRIAPSSPRTAKEVRVLAGTLERRGATLVLGGAGVPELPPSGGVLRVESMAELAAFARGAQVSAN